MLISRRFTVPYYEYQWRWQPMVPVTLRRGQRESDLLATLDSGADECLFHASYGEDLGLDIRRGRLGQLHGIVSGHAAHVFYHPLEIEIGARAKFKCEVAFSYDVGEEWPDQLIGRNVIFSGLEITFRERIRRMHLRREA